MLAERKSPDTSKLHYPLLASPKLDGIRVLMHEGKAYSRSLKPIRNRSIQAWAKANMSVLNGLDGEMVCGAHDSQVFQRTTSVVMGTDGGTDWTFHVFDKVGEGAFKLRFEQATLACATLNQPKLCWVVPHVIINNPYDLAVYETDILEQGYEGVMLRSIDGLYKHGRATLKEGTLLKLKRFVDDEATVVGWEELQHNGNAATTNEVGRTKRSTAAAGLSGGGVLGCLRVRDAAGRKFGLGSGYSPEQRAQLWTVRESLLGKVVVFKHFPIGAKDAPRLPIFKWFRDKEDMS